MSLKKYWIETYGCQMNKAETDSIILQLNHLNMLQAENDCSADFVILNTCSVRKTAEDRIWGRIGHYKHLKSNNPGIKLIIVGCMAERLKEKLLLDGVVDIVVGNFEKHLIGEMIEREHNVINAPITLKDSDYHFSKLHTKIDSNFKAFIPIMHGCNNWCSYCIVPVVRGREISRNPDEVIDEIKELEIRGIREITLLGQNVNSYLFMKNTKMVNFTALLRQISEHTHNIEWIRFLTSHPKDISTELIKLISESDIFCKHIHLPVQHGSDKILNLMGRGYTRLEYIASIKKIKEQIQGVSITSDILIGFPEENEEDFNLTLDLMQEVQFSEAFTYKYNPREGTKAFAFTDTVPEEIKIERLQKVIALQKSITQGNKEKRIGETVKVLVEGISKKDKNELLSRSEKDEIIVFAGNQASIGNFTHVKIIALKGNTFLGKEI